MVTCWSVGRRAAHLPPVANEESHRSAVRSGTRRPRWGVCPPRAYVGCGAACTLRTRAARGEPVAACGALLLPPPLPSPLPGPAPCTARPRSCYGVGRRGGRPARPGRRGRARRGPVRVFIARHPPGGGGAAGRVAADGGARVRAAAEWGHGLVRLLFFFFIIFCPPLLLDAPRCLLWVADGLGRVGLCPTLVELVVHCCKRLLTPLRATPPSGLRALAPVPRRPTAQAAHLCAARHARHGRGGAAVPRRVCARPRHGRGRHPVVLLHLPDVLDPLSAAGRRCPARVLTAWGGGRTAQPPSRCADPPPRPVGPPRSPHGPRVHPRAPPPPARNEECRTPCAPRQGDHPLLLQPRARVGVAGGSVVRGGRVKDALSSRWVRVGTARDTRLEAVKR